MNILLFDLELGGHHASYIHYLSNYWKQSKLYGNLYILVSPKFLAQHAEVADLKNTSQHSVIEFIAITNAEYEALSPRKNGLLSMKRALQEWRLLSQYSHRLKIDHCLLLYLDRTHLPITLRCPLPCPFSSIYFRPTFHYALFQNDNSSLKNQVQALREKVQLILGLSHPKASTLFCLDPFAVKLINQWMNYPRAIYLPDPVPLEIPNIEKVNALRHHLGIEPDCKVFLLFGALTRRKGIYEILKALDILPEENLKQICLLMVGKLNDIDQPIVLEQIQALHNSRPVKIILNNSFVAEEEVPCYFQLADVVLAAYQKHVGMSGILVRAAAAGKPLICSNFGLMGAIARQYHLGLQVDSESPKDIAQAISKCLFFPDKAFDFKKARNFAHTNSVESFAKLIFNSIYSHSQAVEVQPNT